MNATIAIVEDEPRLASLLEDYLEREGYDTIVWENGSEALSAFRRSMPDLILLDLMLPGTDGLSICRELRKDSSVPIIMLTARVEEIDRLLGLEIGADDYICKPYSPREVVARAKAVLRRTQQDRIGDGIAGDAEVAGRHSKLVVNEQSATVSVGGQTTALTAVELKLLLVLSQSPGRIYSREQLMKKIYSDNRVVSDRTIDSHVKKLRQKIEQLNPQMEFIYSVYGLGYKYEPQ